MFKHNDGVTCSIKGTKITNARISIDEDGTPYICQNEQNGGQAENKLGYKYSWALERDFTDSLVTNLKLAEDKSEKTWDNLDYGDVIEGPIENQRTILVAFPNNVYAVSFNDNKNMSSCTYTAKYLQDIGYTIVQEEVKPIRTVTQEEVNKLFGEDVVIK